MEKRIIGPQKFGFTVSRTDEILSSIFVSSGTQQSNRKSMAFVSERSKPEIILPECPILKTYSDIETFKC